MSKWERKFGKYAIPNLTKILITCYAIGYLLQMVIPGIQRFLTLDVYAILHGQVWRLFSWIFSAPTTARNGIDYFLVIIMLFFYYSLGTNLERFWGTWKYNCYIFGGFFFTVLATFICYGITYVFASGVAAESFLATYSAWGGLQISTYYINMSIFLAFAATFPEARVLLMFAIPVKVKWMGIIYGVMLLFEMVECFMYGQWYSVGAIAASLLNFAVFYVRQGFLHHLNPGQVKRRVEFKQNIRRNPSPAVAKHKCAICGRTSSTDEQLEFRFCSRCNGNYEYCQDHLFSHKHVE